MRWVSERGDPTYAGFRNSEGDEGRGIEVGYRGSGV